MLRARSEGWPPLLGLREDIPPVEEVRPAYFALSRSVYCEFLEFAILLLYDDESQTYIMTLLLIGV
jgi:hypothetical protein